MLQIVKLTKTGRVREIYFRLANADEFRELVGESRFAFAVFMMENKLKYRGADGTIGKWPYFCETCGAGCVNPNPLSTKPRKYCSPECARKSTTRKPNPVSVQAVCEYCEEPFAAKRSDARYCSAKCRVYANRAAAKQ